ncbi:MAG: archaellin/type IV pilin N-terminal domain-containing protein [Candidatus Bathycorpusculaceae bacterium]
MLTKRMLRSRKAISPILATLLLIVIAVAAIVVTYAWIMTYMGSASQQAGVILYKENVRFYGTPADADKNLTEIAIGNSGRTDTKILRIYMGNSSGNMVELTSYSDIGSGKTLLAGSVAKITLNWPNMLANNWEAGKTYYLRVVPAQGPYLEFQEQAPL